MLFAKRIASVSKLKGGKLHEAPKVEDAKGDQERQQVPSLCQSPSKAECLWVKLERSLGSATGGLSTGFIGLDLKVTRLDRVTC